MHTPGLLWPCPPPALREAALPRRHKHGKDSLRCPHEAEAQDVGQVDGRGVGAERNAAA